jgi:hypothetical protein
VTSSDGAGSKLIDLCSQHRQTYTPLVALARAICVMRRRQQKHVQAALTKLQLQLMSYRRT